jgi:hypothetical protein
MKTRLLCAKSVRRLLRLVGVGAVASVVATQPASAEEVMSDTFAMGGTFCFDIGSGSSGDHQHFKLVAAPAASRAPYNVIEVHAIEKGAFQNVKYLNGLAGTATLGPSSVPNATENTLHISLMGNGNSFKKNGAPELWTLRYSMELSADTMIGTLYGYAEESTSIAEGKSYSIENSFYMLRQVEPMRCEAF